MKKKLTVALMMATALFVIPFSRGFGQVSEVEPNDTCLTAQDVGAVTLPLSVNGELSGTPLPTGDVDFLRFAGPPNVGARADLEGSATGAGTLGDPYLGLFDSGCNLIALDDDSGVGLNSQLTFNIPGDGTFILAVTRCCDSSFTQGGNGTYQLNVIEILPPPNDNFASAEPVTSIPFQQNADLSAASTEAGEPTPTCATYYQPVKKTAWYSFTPSTNQSISAFVNNYNFNPFIAAYTGSGLNNLTEVGSRCFGGRLTFQAVAGTTYYLQLGGLFGQGGLAQLNIEVPPPPNAYFFFYPNDPSTLDMVQFYDYSYDPGEIGIQFRGWDFGDGATLFGEECCPTHQYAADGDYTVYLEVTTFDGRTGSISRPLQVRTHDVGIVKVSAPKSAIVGQTVTITVELRNSRYPETVRVDLYKSVQYGFAYVASLTQDLPVRASGREMRFTFTYTFTKEDAAIGMVAFRAYASINNYRDAFPADNEATSSPPTQVNTQSQR